MGRAGHAQGTCRRRVGRPERNVFGVKAVQRPARHALSGRPGAVALAPRGPPLSVIPKGRVMTPPAAHCVEWCVGGCLPV